MKRNSFIHRCGPYKVVSYSQDGHGVRLVVYPAFPPYESKSSDSPILPWAIRRAKGEGGGPGIITAIALAREFEEFLNQSYSPEAIQAWKETLAQSQKKENGCG